MSGSNGVLHRTSAHHRWILWCERVCLCSTTFVYIRQLVPTAIMVLIPRWPLEKVECTYHFRHSERIFRCFPSKTWAMTTNAYFVDLFSFGKLCCAFLCPLVRARPPSWILMLISFKKMCFLWYFSFRVLCQIWLSLKELYFILWLFYKFTPWVFYVCSVSVVESRHLTTNA